MSWAWGSPALRMLAVVLVLLLYLLLCGLVVLRERRRRLAARQAAATLASGPTDDGGPAWLVVFASQTGQAEHLAWQTAQALHTAGLATRLLPLGQLDPASLQAAERALFIVSTHGEGDAPDTALPFVRHGLGQTLPLPALHCGVLALGDSSYTHFCGFGRQLDTWLQQQGAQALFPRIEVDRLDPAALTDWQHRLSHLAGTQDMPDWEAPPFEAWQLVRRQHLNPGSLGRPTFHLELSPPPGQPLPDWQAGDLVQVQVPSDPQRPREYSVASIPADGRIHLLVRQERHPDGSLGRASGWLTTQVEPGGTVALRLRAHTNFRLGPNTGRPLILVGNGTGLAGLRGHLRAQALAGTGTGSGAPLGHWLVFGERQAAHDFYYQAEIESWRQSGLLARADLVFSRDQPARRHVQDLLREQADTLRDWLDRGAALYVCGSLHGMAGGVDAALTEALGRDRVDQLLAEGRYRRDVY